MSYIGDIRLGDTIDFHFTTRQISGAPSTLSGTPALACYPSNSTTQVTAGITLDVDFDSVTGLNHVRIVASNGNGYATATDYSVVITTGTVNSVSVVGEVIGSFSIEHRSALMPTTAARTLVVDAAGLADANTVKIGPSGSGTAQTAGDVGIKTGFALSATASAALTESYAADGAAPTLAQILYQIWSFLGEKNVSGTTLTAKKLDGSTTAMTFTLDSSSAPTSITRTT